MYGLDLWWKEFFLSIWIIVLFRNRKLNKLSNDLSISLSIHLSIDLLIHLLIDLLIDLSINLTSDLSFNITIDEYISDLLYPTIKGSINQSTEVHHVNGNIFIQDSCTSCQCTWITYCTRCWGRRTILLRCTMLMEMYLFRIPAHLACVHGLHITPAAEGGGLSY